MQMSREDYVAVAARLFAIYLVFLVVISTPLAVQSLMMPGGGMEFLGWFVTSLVICLAIAALLWLFPLTVARKLLPVMKEPRSDTAINGSLAMSLGLVLMGVWFLANAIADGFYWLVYFAQAAQLPTYSSDWQPEQTANIVAALVQLVLAMILIFGHAGIRRLVHRIRYGADIPPPA